MQDLGFRLLGTEGTVTYFSKAGLEIESIPQLAPGETRLLDLILDGEVDLVVNTLLLGASYEDGASIRRAVTEKDIPLITTTSAALAALDGIRALRVGLMLELDLWSKIPVLEQFEVTPPPPR